MTKTRYIATLLATAAIGAAISLAPAALAATGTTGAPTLENAVVADPASPDPAPAAPTGGDPQVPYGTNVNTDVDNFDGNSLAY
jgi:hypothetical protein